LLDIAFGLVGLNWADHVQIDPTYVRPAEVDVLEGDFSKAKRLLGWEPKVSFEELISMMVDSDMKLAHQERALVDAGLRTTEWRDGRP
jgi:GDPmannose 4,6-dehydratase